MNVLRLLTAVLVVGLVAGGAAQARGGSYVKLQAPGAVRGTFPTGINQQGDIVGNYTTRHGRYGFVLHRGHYTTIDPRHTATTEVYGINGQSAVVGSYYVPGTGPQGGTHGFMLR